MRERARQAREQASEWADRGRDVVNQQKEQFRSAYEAGRQAYHETTAKEAGPQICRAAGTSPPAAVVDRESLWHLTIFIAVTAAAVVLQAGILFGMFLAVRKTGPALRLWPKRFEPRSCPPCKLRNPCWLSCAPRSKRLMANISETTTMMRAQLQRVDATVSDVVDRSRLQVIRADDMVSSYS